MTFGGLRREYYFRNLFIGIAFGVAIWLMMDALEARSSNPKSLQDLVIIKGFVVLNSVLYPYAKFLYDYLWQLIRGDNVYAYHLNLFSIWFILVARLMCWFFAWAIAPVGLLILYLKNR